MNTPEVEERLAHLEKQSRRLKTVALAALALGGGTFLGGPGRGLLPGRLGLRQTLEAETFTLRDAKGRTRGTITVQNDRPTLKLYDSAANELVVLAGTPEGVGGSDSEGGLWLSASHHRELVELVATTEPGLILNNPNGKASVELLADAEYPRLWLSDSQGNVRAQLEVRGEQASTLKLSGSNGNGEAKLEVARMGERLRRLVPGQEYEESLTLEDEGSTPRVFLGSISTRQGLILRDAEGRNTYAVGSGKPR